ncbi:MAG: DUF3131 domain-containing protein [Gemmatimonadetes bacterium]|nr:DUF3131 domain-containing protein [Gemmatimonadota bacterium]
MGMLRSAHRFAFVTLTLLLTAGCLDNVGPVAPDPDPDPRVTNPHPDQAIFLDAARTAWHYADTQYQPATGLINSVHGYKYATVWDIASGLSAMYCANRLGLLPRAEYDARMGRALKTLETMPLFDGAVFSKNYRTPTAAIAGRDDRDTHSSERGTGWSSTDVGRLLVWLRIIAEKQPRYAAQINRIVARLDLNRVVVDGYLWGTDVDAAGNVRRYPEGQLGYEQYAARGFELWGYPAPRALSLSENTSPVQVLGVPLLADRRGGEYLTSEPFILGGLEVGWNAEMRTLSERVLKVQEERFKRTGQMTIVSEDHVPVAPWYFYYYSIHRHGKQFVVNVQGSDVDLNDPRWISAKAAYAWHALLPGGYTRSAVDAVAAARTSRGWSSGVYEDGRGSTGSENINTAAVILQAALYSRTGLPLIDQ